jgi:hypothetical protein
LIDKDARKLSGNRRVPSIPAYPQSEGESNDFTARSFLLAEGRRIAPKRP